MKFLMILSLLCLSILSAEDDLNATSTRQSGKLPLTVQPNITIIAPLTPHRQISHDYVLYLITNKSVCENCLNLSPHPKKPLKLFLGRLIINQKPFEIRFEPIKESLEESDIASKEYLLSHQYYDSLAQANLFYTREIQKTRDYLQQIDFFENDTVLTIFKKLEPNFHFACNASGELYWNKQWVLDREALLWSGISNQQKGNISHLSMQLGSCSLKPDINEIEPPGCDEWRRLIKQYPPLKACTILGNPL